MKTTHCLKNLLLAAQANVSPRWSKWISPLQLAMVLAFLNGGNSALAQSSYTWNGGSGTTGNWSDGGNWGGSGPANPQGFLNFNGAARTSNTNDFSSGGPGYQFYFKNGASAFSLYGNLVVFYDFGGGVNDPNIQNEGTSPAQTINFPIANGNNNGTFHVLNINVNTGTSQGPLTFNGAVSSADAGQALRVINIYGPSAINFNGVISDFDSTHKLALSQLGSGTTTLTASNTFTGDMTVNAGTLVLATNSALANSTNFVRLGDTGATGVGASLNLNGGNNLSTSINVRSGSSGGKIIADTLGTTGNATFLGNLFLDADVTAFANVNGTNVFSGATLDLKNQTLTVDGTGNTTISGTLTNSTGSGKIVKNSTGVLTLSGNNFHTGGTTLNTGGTININSTNALGTGAFTIGGSTAVFDNTSGAAISNANNNALTISGGSPTFTGTKDLNFGTGIVTVSGANRTLTVSASTLTLGGGVTDNSGVRKLTKAGAGTLVMNGAAGIWTGGSSLDAGTLIVGTDATLGTGNLALNGGTLVATNGARSLSNPVTLTASSAIGGNTALTFNSSGSLISSGGSRTLTINNTGGTTLAGPVFLSDDNSTAGRTVTLAGSGSTTISGVIANNSVGNTVAVNMVYSNTATTTISSTNTYSGTTTLAAGIVQANTNNVFGTGNITVTTAGNTGKFLLNGVTITNALTMTGVGPGPSQGVVQGVDTTFSTWSGPITINSNSSSGGHFLGPVTSGLLNISGPVSLGGVATFIVVRDGRVRFSGGGSYTNLDIRSSSTSLGANNGLSTTAVVDIGGNGSPTVPTMFDLNGFNQTLAGVKNSVNSTFVAWVTNSVSGTQSTFTFLNSGLQTFNGSIVGNLAVNVVGGTQVYSSSAVAGNGVFGYTGDTTISGGTLKTAAANLLPNGTGKGNLIVTNTGVLDLNTFSQTVNGLSGNGTVDTVAGGTPTLTVGSNNASSTFGGYLKNTAGTLALTKFGTGTLTLTGTNIHNGITTIAAGSTIQYQGAPAMSTNSQLTLQNTAVAQLRADVNTAFTNGNLNPAGGATVTFDVNQLTGTGANNVLTLASTNAAGYTVGGNGVTMTFNITGGNGDSLLLPGNANFSGNANNGFMLVPTTANVSLVGNVVGTSGNAGQVLTLDGTASSNAISGTISGSGGLSLMKQNSSTWYLFGANTFPGDTRVVGGTLSLSNALALQSSTVNLTNTDSGTLNLNNLNATLGGLKGSRNFALGTGTVSIGNNSSANTYSGSLSGTAINKVGTGAWTLSGTNTFAGTTVVNAGELIGQTGSSLSNSVVTVSTSATNGVLLAAVNGQWACSNLTYSAGTTYADFNFNGNALSTTTAPLLVNGNLAFTVTPNVIVRSAGAIIAPGTYPLIKYTGTLSGTPPASVFSLPVGVTATLVNNTGNKSIDLNVTVGNAVNWAVGNATWDINTTASWTNNVTAALVNYLDGEAVVLDDTASGVTPITISLGVTVAPTSITANLTNKSYTISPTAAAGLFTGSGALVKNGSGTLTIGTTNSTYTGTITLNGGTLSLSGLASLGTGTLIMNNGTTLNVPNISPVGTTPTIIVAAGATANQTVSGGNTGGFGGYIASGDSNSVLVVSSVSYSGAFQMFSNFTGTVQLNSAANGLRFSSSTAGATFGGSNATFNVLSGGTLGPRDNGHNVYLGALTGSGSLTANTTTSASGTVPYFIGSKNIDTTFSGTISDRPVTNFTSVTKIGSATLTLSGTNTYWGATTVASGTLMGVTGGSCSNSPVTVNSGATNGVSVTTPGNQWTCTNLTYAAGTEYALFAFGANTPSTTVAPLLIQNGLTISGTLNILITGGSTTMPVGTYPLIRYTNTLSGTVPVVPFSLPQYVSGVITNDTANKVIALIVTNVITPTLAWSAGTGTWETNSLNWTNTLAGALTNWADGNLALFDDTASGAGPFTVTLNTNVNPLNVLFTNITKNYTLAGTGGVIGSGGLTKAGAGTLVLAATNSFTGGTVISGGTLQGSSATLLGSIANNAALVFDQTFNGSNSAVIGGTGSLTKQNSGLVALGGNNNYTGKTFVNAGTLAISAGANVGGNPGSATTNQLTINGGTLLATNGAATITLPVNAGITVGNAGATIDVGTGITLDYPAQAISGTGSLTKNGAGTFQIDEGNASSTYTNLTLNAGTIAFNKSSGGLGSGPLVINGGVIRTTGSSGRSPTNPNIFVNADFTLGSATANGAITFANGGAWTLVNGNRTFNIDTITTTITGVIGDGGNNYQLIKSGSGTLVLSNADTFTGGISMTAGNLNLGNNSAAGTGSTVAYSGGSVQVGNGITITNKFDNASSTTTDLMMDCPTGTGVWAGPVTSSSTGGFRPGTSGGTLIFSGNGSLGNRNLIVPRGTVIFATNANFSCAGGTIAFGRSTAGSGTSVTVQNNTVLSLTGANGIQLGGAQASPGPIIFAIQDSASVTASNTASFDLNNSTSNSVATTVNLNGGSLTVGGFVKSQTGGGQTSTLNFNGGNITANAANAAFLPALTGLTAYISANGAFVNDGGFAIALAQPLLHDPTLGATADGGLTKSGVGVTTVSGTNNYTGPTTVSAGKLLVSGVLGTNLVTVATNATLSGNGIINGATTIQLGGTVQPGLGGLDTSTFAISNSLTLAGNAVLTLNRTNAQTAAKISGLTTVTYGGTLTVTNVGSALQSGDTFTLFQAATYSGAFTTIILPSLGSGLAWNTNNLAVNGSISVGLSISPSALALVSSANPAGYLDALTYTATVTPTNATGSVTFFNGATPFSTNLMTLGVATSASISTLARGTNTITATYIGDVNYYGSTNSLAQVVTNHPPVVNANTYARNNLPSWKILVSDLLTTASDVDGDTLSLAAVGNSTNGVTLDTNSFPGYVVYYNSNTVTDQFTYFVADGYGGTNSAVITLNSSSPASSTGQVASFTIAGGVASMTFLGIPGFTYNVQRATNDVSGPWFTIWTTNAPTGGAFQFDDSGVTAPSAYYRLSW